MNTKKSTNTTTNIEQRPNKDIDYSLKIIKYINAVVACILTTLIWLIIIGVIEVYIYDAPFERSLPYLIGFLPLLYTVKKVWKKRTDFNDI